MRHASKSFETSFGIRPRKNEASIREVTVRRLILLATGLLVLSLFFTLHAQERIDSAAMARIKEESMNRSQVMGILSYITDIYGPRLTYSPGYKRAAEWAHNKLAGWGMENARIEGVEPLGRGWELKRFSANVIARQAFPLISYPAAWSPGTRGTVSGDVVLLDAKTDSDLETYHGKLKGKFVVIAGTSMLNLNPHFEPEASRRTDSSLLKLANAGMPGPQRQRIEYDTFTKGFWGLTPGNRQQRRFDFGPQNREQFVLLYHKMVLCQQEGATAILTPSRGDGGNVLVDGARVATHPDTPLVGRLGPWDPKAPNVLPRIAVSAEQYNRIVRLLQKGERVKMEMNLDVEFFKEDSVYNIIAEIPGTDMKDEVVMIGAHFDSWHGGTGATDNGTGSAVCIEAMRVLKALDLKPRRTIRIGLWGGEEQGALGSKAYVKKYLGGEGTFFDPGVPVKLRSEANKFSAYFNLDEGTGKIRGVRLQENEGTLPIFRAWLAPFKEWNASTLTLSNSYGSDHLSFDGVGLPGFGFIQDPIDYDTRTHHYTMDVYDRAQEEDLKQAATIMAAFIYNAAMRDEKIPRK